MADIFDTRAEFEARKKLSKEQILCRLDEWALSGNYEIDMYNAGWRPKQMVEEIMRVLFPFERSSVKIIDVAAGTGLVGQKLLEMGFKDIDAVDPSSGMMQVALERNIYKKYYKEYVDGTEIAAIKTDSYDVAMVFGAFSEGMLPANAIFEIIRIVKKGGLIIFTAREDFETYVEDYKERWTPLLEQFQEKGELKFLRKDMTEYTADNTRDVIFVYTVLVSRSIIPHLPPLNGKN